MKVKLERCLHTHEPPAYQRTYERFVEMNAMPSKGDAIWFGGDVGNFDVSGGVLWIENDGQFIPELYEEVKYESRDQLLEDAKDIESIGWQFVDDWTDPNPHA